MNKQMQYLFVGLPFAGKTTLAQKLEKRFGFVRLSIDEVKFEMGYTGISDSDIPKETWTELFNELDKRVIQVLKEGKTLLNEYAWFTKYDRDKGKSLAEPLGVETKIIYVRAPEELVRKRWQENRRRNKRHDIANDVFEEALRLFEPPTDGENIIIFSDGDDVNEWIRKNI